MKEYEYFNGKDISKYKYNDLIYQSKSMQRKIRVKYYNIYSEPIRDNSRKKFKYDKWVSKIFYLHTSNLILLVRYIACPYML